MSNEYGQNDYEWIAELINYPYRLSEKLDFFEDTAQISIPEDPIERVIFQSRAKQAIRKVAQHRGHLLMVGKPGTGKSMLANMFQTVLDSSLGDYLRPKDAIVAYPGKDRHHIRIAYESPAKMDSLLAKMNQEIEAARNQSEDFSLEEQIRALRRVLAVLLVLTGAAVIGGFFYTPGFILAGITGIGAIFMVMQENNHRVQEKIQRENLAGRQHSVKHLYDMIPEILYDPRSDSALMARVSEPDSRNMKGGFRHDPYQSGNLQTPPHQRAYLGAHATSPIIYIDELKTLIKVGYMPDLLEVMQNQAYILEGGRNTGSGAADRSENEIRAENIIVACCNHDTLTYLQKEGEGAFLSRIEDKGEIIHMEAAVIESRESICQVAQYVKQEIEQLGKEFTEMWGYIEAEEGREGVRRRCEKIFGRRLPQPFDLREREFTRSAVLEIIKEMRCRSTDRKLSCILRPINGIIKTAEIEAIVENAPLVEARHVHSALREHQSLEGAIAQETGKFKRDLKKYIGSLTDSIGYVVGLAVIHSESSGRMYGQPLPIHCQINAGGSDTVLATGKLGDIAKAASQNVRASIKKVLSRIGASYVGYEMHIEYIQAHGGVEGDSASLAIDVALISDFIRQPVNQKYGVTGSLTGDIILAVGGVTEKLRCIMDPALGMEGACIPWLNKHDVEPHLINTDCQYIQKDDVPGIRIFRGQDRTLPFDVYFCKTKYNAYRILMDLNKTDVQNRMAGRSRKDIELSGHVEQPDETPDQSTEKPHDISHPE